MTFLPWPSQAFPCQHPLKTLLAFPAEVMGTVSADGQPFLISGPQQKIIHLPPLAKSPGSTQTGLLTIWCHTCRKQSGETNFVSSLGKMQTSLNRRVWDTASFSHPSKFMLLCLLFTVMQHEPFLFSNTISSFAILNKERRIKRGSDWTTYSK